MTEREKFIAGLRQMADFLGTHPDVKCPGYGNNWHCGIQPNEIRKTAKTLRTFKKVYDATDFSMVKMFGPHSITYYTSREAVCKKVVVGQKEIPEMIVAAKPAQVIEATEERIIPAHIEEITEWVCSDAALTADETEPVMVGAATESNLDMPF